MTQIGIGIVGGGYMGKAHAVAMAAVGAVFDTALRPSLEVICTTTEAGAADKARQFGFKRSTADWRMLVDDPTVAGHRHRQPAGNAPRDRTGRLRQGQTCAV